MTALMTRGPLQPLENTHASGRFGGNERRTSARLADRNETQCVKPDKTSDKLAANLEANRKVDSTGKGTLSTSNKRKMTYDEEDEGFAFTRKRSKKISLVKETTKSTVQVETQANKQEVPNQRKPRKKSFNSPPSKSPPERLVVEKKRAPKENRSHHDADSATLTAKRKSRRNESNDVKAGDAPDKLQISVSNEQTLQQTVDPSQSPHQFQTSFDATKIALPFADTPIIRRNKEMRKGAQTGSRRSSLGLRGRRASSLIDAGKSSALPHDEVDSSDFYKHIESEGLSEPRRMRQLLMWCGARALGSKPSFGSEDGNARLAAREIQSQLLKDFSVRSDLSDWFDRKESARPAVAPKPNPQNLSNLAKIEELEQRITRLQMETQSWQTLLRPPPEDSLKIPPVALDVAPSDLDAKTVPSSQHGQVSDTVEQHDKHSTVALATSASRRLEAISADLEFEIDQFATGLHVMSSYKRLAEKVADGSLVVSARTLEEKDHESMRNITKDFGDAASTRDVLRTLSRIIDR